MIDVLDDSLVLIGWLIECVSAWFDLVCFSLFYLLTDLMDLIVLVDWSSELINWLLGWVVDWFDLIWNSDYIDWYDRFDWFDLFEWFDWFDWFGWLIEWID